ncbi:MAG: LysM peptidoglycan-binding domain-containing protein, partial [Anaerolineae bacterium]
MNRKNLRHLRLSASLWGLFLLISLMLAMTWLPLQAQENPTPGLPPIPFIHTVQEGENLTFIAANFGLTVEELQAANNLAPDDLLFVGQELIIPGREGSEVATFYTIQAGDTLSGIAAMFNTTATAVAQSNHLLTTDPPLVVGDAISITSRTGSASPRPVTGTPHVVAANEGWLAIAARYRLSPSQLATSNQQLTTDYLLPGQRLRLPSDQTYRDLPGEWVDVEIRPLPIVQGFTTSIYVENLLDGLPSGQFAGQPLHFTPYKNGYVALVGLDAFAETGLQTLELMGSGSRPWTPFRQTLRVQSGGYGQQYITIPDDISYLLAPEIRANEDAILGTVYSQFSEPQQWEGLFTLPVTGTIVTAPYGDARSYNGGPFEIFHTGVDFGGGFGTPILAPANGTVVFTDTMELHGNTLVIDHGLGVMSVYFHLSEFFVKVGDTVTAGQPVAAGGN